MAAFLDPRGADRATRSCRCASCACAGLVGSSVVRGFLVTGMYSTFFLGTLYLEHVLHYGALQTGLAFLPWTLTVGGAVARRHRAPGRALRRDPRAGRRHADGRSPALACSRPSGRTRASSRPSSWPTSPSVSGSAARSCRCCTIAMADVPAADAGLGSGIVNVSQQVAGALGLAVLGTIATNRTPRAARRPTIRSSDRCSAGYHLAFADRRHRRRRRRPGRARPAAPPRPREPDVVVEPEILRDSRVRRRALERPAPPDIDPRPRRSLMTTLITNPARHRAQIVAEAVVSAYIHEIARRSAGASAPQPVMDAPSRRGPPPARRWAPARAGGPWRRGVGLRWRSSEPKGMRAPRCIPAAGEWLHCAACGSGSPAAAAVAFASHSTGMIWAITCKRSRRSGGWKCSPSTRSA